MRFVTNKTFLVVACTAVLGLACGDSDDEPAADTPAAQAGSGGTAAGAAGASGKGGSSVAGSGGAAAGTGGAAAGAGGAGAAGKGGSAGASAGSAGAGGAGKGGAGGAGAGGAGAGGAGAGGAGAGGAGKGGAAGTSGSAGAGGAGAGGVGGAAGTAGAGGSIGQQDIVDTAIAAGNFKTLVAAVQAAELVTALKSPGPFTVFAPTDDAFAKVPSFLVSQLVTPPYKTELGLILKYHVLSGSVKAADVLGKTQSVATLEGGKLSVDGTSGKVVVNGGVNVVAADVLASNGVIHAVDGVLLPTIVDTAVGYDDGTNKFSTLVAAATAADLAGALSGPGTYTVFAPTDAAFDALKASIGQAAFDAILADKAKLTKILTYHALPAIVYAKDITSGDAVTTLEGDKLTIKVIGGSVTIADSTTTEAKVLLADLPNSNGVIHAIDKVLLPPNL